MNSAEVSGKLALITGAGRGIGRSIAESFLHKGLRVALTDVDAALVEATARSLGAEDRIRAFTLDVRDRAAFEAVVQQVEGSFGPIDILVNNAGIMSLGPFVDQPEKADRQQLEVNVLGVINGMRSVLPRMQARKQGHVVNVASMAGKLPVPYAAVYAATKHAVVGLSESVRVELEGSGVRLSYVLPIPVKTDLIAGVGNLRWPPPVEPQDVAQAVWRCISKNEVDVFVPRIQKLSAALPVLLPRVVAESLARWLGVDRFFRDVDTQARAAYVARTLDK